MRSTSSRIGSVMSWRTSSKRWLSIRWMMLSLLPVKKLSRQITSCPSSRRRSHRCEPTKPAPPVTRMRMLFHSSADAAAAASEWDIAETGRRHAIRFVQVAAVHNCRRSEGGLDAVEVRIAVFAPVGDDRQGVGAVQDVILVVAVFDPVAEDLFGFLDRFRVMGPDSGAGGKEALD